MLLVGDYAAEYRDGTVCPVYFERKSITDLFGTMTNGYKRFKAEINRAKTAELQLILAIEGKYTDVFKGVDYSSFEGRSMIRKLMTLWQRYGLTPVFFESREAMADMIKEFYIAFGKNFKLKGGV